MAEHLLVEILIIAIAAVVAALVRLGASPILGYLAAGLAIGPNVSGVLVLAEGTHCSPSWRTAPPGPRRWH